MHTKILVAYFIISDKKLKYKWRISAARPTYYFIGIIFLFFWATVCKTVRPMPSDCCLSVCLSCLSVTLVYCGQRVGWMKMKFDMEVGLALASLCQMGTQLALPKGETPNFWPMSVVAKGLDRSRYVSWHRGQNATW